MTTLLATTYLPQSTFLSLGVLAWDEACRFSCAYFHRSMVAQSLDVTQPRSNLLTTASGLSRSCAQNRSTRQPALRNSLVTTLSLCLFRFSFRSQKLRLLPGVRPCFGHPCQKQPSTNTAGRSRRKMKSGLPGNRWCRRQPLIPCARKIDASFNSVSLLPFDRMAAMTCERFFFENTSAIDS